MDPKRPIEEIKTEAAAILAKTIEGTAYGDDGYGGHLYFSKEQKQLILSAAESIPRLDTEDLKRKIYDGANAPTIADTFINAYKKAYRANERAAAKQAAQTTPTPSESAPAKTEAEPLPEPQPDALPQDQARPEHAEEYTAAEIKEIESNLIDVAGIPESCDFSKYVKTYGRDKVMLNEWLNGYGLGAAIPGNEEPAETAPAHESAPAPAPAPAEAETLPEPEAEQEPESTEAEPIAEPASIPEPIGPAEAITEPQPSESQQEPAPSIPPHLNEHKRALNEHIANIRDDKQRAAFYDERDAITKGTAGNLETQDQEILTLCLKVKTAEDKQATKPETDPLTIRDDDTGTIIKATAAADEPAENITGTAEAEAATEELDTAAKARKMLNLNRPHIPPHLRAEPYRNFKNAVIKTDDGRTIKNPAYISAEPQDANYIINTLNNTNLARRIAAELDGEILYNESKDEWTIWKDTAYIPDKSMFNAAIIYAIETLYNEAVYLSNVGIDANAIKALMKFTNTSKNDKNITSTLARLKCEFGISVNFNTDASQDLISLNNIIFNSATGEIIKATDTARINEIRKLIPYHHIDGTYDPLAVPAEYLKMVYVFFYDNTTPDLSDEERDRRAREGAAWYLRYRGYVLFSGNPAGINLVLIGPPHNGKTTLARASGQPLKTEYDELSAISEIYASHTGPLEQYSKLAPLRECLIDEGAGGEEKGQKLSGNFFKNTTTARKIRARGIYQKDNQIAHNLKRTLTMNEAPHFDTIDGGTLRRMVVPPCLHHYTEADKIPDYDTYLLAKEGNAILSLMINECIHYIHGNPDAPAGSPERNPGLLPIPEHWKEYKAKVLGGTIFTMFLIENYEPITDPAEKTKENRIYKTDMIRGLIEYATKNNCLDELGQLAISNETLICQSRNGTEYAAPDRTLNKAAIKQLNVALLELGFGPWTNAHDTPKAYINAKEIGPGNKTKWNF